ncbi:MAG: 4'-phosphopantetheinyl transferase superfamily protein [Oscillospiraceae bacterium]|nr:4'-phosphopantetheinyl transferase superfamily protein [Oscillospiraceae bacterium]
MSVLIITHITFFNTKINKKYFRFLPEKRREKIYTYRKSEDRIRCYAAGLSGIAAASLLLDTSPENIDLISEEWKAPYAVSGNGEKIYLSISHSGSFVLCAADTLPCGADVEQIRNIPDLTDIAQRIFHKKEVIRLTASPDLYDSFFRLWTLKEAYLKYLGTGLSRKLSSFSLYQDNLRIQIDDPINTAASSVFFSSWAENDYRFGLAAHNNTPQQIRFTLDELEKYFEQR